MGKMKSLLVALVLASAAFCLFLVAMERSVSSVSRFPGRPSSSSSSTGRYPVIRQHVSQQPSSRTFPPEVLWDTLRLHFQPTRLCPVGHPHPDVRWNNIYWQEALGSALFLYSAYWDARIVHGGRPYNYVRVLGMAQSHNSSSRLYCQLWLPYSEQPITVRAFRDEVWVRQWDYSPQVKKYQPILLHCPIPLEISQQQLIPDHVSVTSTPCGKPTTWLPVQTVGYYENRKGKPKHHFAVCVKGLDFHKDISKTLSEWLELQFLLGAAKVFVYILSVHPKILKLLHHYEKQGLVDLKLLTLPGDQPNLALQRSKFLKRQIWQKRRDELIPYNDCFYRSLYRFRYVIPLDIDEAIVPIRARTWNEMFRSVLDAKQSDAASFSARNVYFFSTMSATFDPSVPSYLRMLRYTTRSANFSQPGHSVKSFVATCCALMVFNHYALKPLFPRLKLTVLLNESVAQLNHYRDECPRTMMTECLTNYLPYKVEDTILLKYKNDLISRVKHVLSVLKLL